MRNFRWRPALVLLCTADVLVTLDGTVVTIALPAIERDLGAGTGTRHGSICSERSWLRQGSGLWRSGLHGSSITADKQYQS
jgi:hypothetical protein